MAHTHLLRKSGHSLAQFRFSQHILGVLLTLLATEKSLDMVHTNLLRKSGHSQTRAGNNFPSGEAVIRGAAPKTPGNLLYGLKCFRLMQSSPCKGLKNELR